MERIPSSNFLAPPLTWTVNTTTVVKHAGVDVGERKNLSFKKKGKSTGWVMEEYRLLLSKAVVGDEEKVFCKIHLSQHPPDEARRESAAYKHQGRAEPVARPAPQPEHVGKRTAPAAATDPHPPRPMKRIRVVVPVPEPATPSFTAAAPVSLPAAFMEGPGMLEADDRFSCTMEELFGDAAEEIVGNNNAPADHHAPFEAEWQAEEALDMETLLAIIDEATAEQEPQAVSTNDNSSIVHDRPPPIFFHTSEAQWQADEALEKEKRYNAAADLQAP